MLHALYTFTLLHPHLVGKGALKRYRASDALSGNQGQQEGEGTKQSPRPGEVGLDTGYGRGRPEGRGLGLLAEASVLMPPTLLANRTPGAVPQHLGRSGLLCHWTCPLYSPRCQGHSNRVRDKKVYSPRQTLMLRAGSLSKGSAPHDPWGAFPKAATVSSLCPEVLFHLMTGVHSQFPVLCPQDGAESTQRDALRS